MAKLNFSKEMNSAFILNGDPMRGAMPRWTRKLDDSSKSNNCSRAAMSMSCTASSTPFKPISTKISEIQGNLADFTGRKKPMACPVSRNTNGNDRFIPSRSASNFQISNYLVKHKIQRRPQLEEHQDKLGCINRESIQLKLISDSLELGDLETARVLYYQNKNPIATKSSYQQLFSTPLWTKNRSRNVSVSPERILDAPKIIDDHCLNVLDWSCKNVISVALGNKVYLWNAESCSVEELVKYENGDHARGLAWERDGQILAIGRNTGAVELWDCQRLKRLRVMDGHSARVGAVAWNSYVLSTGSGCGSIMQHDVRAHHHQVSTLNGHTHEVCDLKWSTDYKFLASGGKDNLVNIWSTPLGGGLTTGTEPVHRLSEHQTAVHALAWCPWKRNILATGGGAADPCIKFWNANNGSLTQSVDTQSEVCALLWSNDCREIISAHGSTDNQLTIWKYPAMVPQTQLAGHTARVLHMAMSPDASSVISAGADETLRLWKCFTSGRNKTVQPKAIVKKADRSMFSASIR